MAGSRAAGESHRDPANAKSVLITDLDNTVWDWVDIWYRSFSAMLEVLVDMSGVSRERLEAEIREVHRRHGTSEYAFLIEELPALRALHPGADLSEVFAPAIEAFRKARREALRPYPGVEETLGTLAKRGTLLVAYTESLAFYTRYRLRRTDLDRLVDVLYSPEDHELPEGASPEEIRAYPGEHYVLEKTEHRHTPADELKPNPRVLLDIVEDLGASRSDCVYIGDSKMKDIPMAQDASVDDVWAAYGQAQHRRQYELLRRVTHWTEEDVARERELMKRGRVTPTHSVGEFAEILDLFRFEAFEGAPSRARRGRDSTRMGSITES